MNSLCSSQFLSIDFPKLEPKLHYGKETKSANLPQLRNAECLALMMRWTKHTWMKQSGKCGRDLFLPLPCWRGEEDKFSLVFVLVDCQPLSADCCLSSSRASRQVGKRKFSRLRPVICQEWFQNSVSHFWRWGLVASYRQALSQLTSILSSQQSLKSKQTEQWMVNTNIQSAMLYCTYNVFTVRTVPRSQCLMLAWPHSSFAYPKG